MRQHLIPHRFVGFAKDGQTQIRERKPFDVAAARKMLRDGATIEAIGEAQGVSGQCVRNRLRALGLGYLISDRVRRGYVHSQGQLARIERVKAAR